MPDSYDSVPYTSYCYAFTHPDTLCTLGRLFGLSPAAPTRCRVLELGCASGGNLIPMAEQLPDSAFVGVDRARVQVERGRALIGELGLSNIELVHADILALDVATLGTFDYVICHGVYSWVPRPVQDRILTLIAAVLRPGGLAFISYNVYPGWHMRETVRRMMLFHQRRFDSPEQQVEQSRALLDFVASTVKRRAADDDPYALMLERELDSIRKMSDAYLFHEHLERDNTPLYFHEFIERLQAVPLRYLCDTNLNLMVTHDLPSDAREALARVATDQVSMEQYLDFVRNRQFRTSVLCRADARPQRRLQPACVESLRLCMRGQPSSEPVELAPDVELGFACSSGARISSGQTLTKAALLELCERWPASVEFDALVELACARARAAGFEPALDRSALAADMVECLLRKAIIGRSHAGTHANELAKRPALSPFSRLMAEREGWIASLHHHHISLEQPRRQLIALLDGTRDRAALLAGLAELVASKQLTIRDAAGEALTAGPELDAALASVLDEQLEWLRTLPALCR